jgi:predicted amidohydrolase
MPTISHRSSPEDRRTVLQVTSVGSASATAGRTVASVHPARPKPESGRAPLAVAAVQPACAAHDVVRNARAHADAIRAAQARVVVFPELSLTGYELDARAVAPDDVALAPIVDACAATRSVALAGAPTADTTADGEGERAFITMLRIDTNGVQVADRKTWLGDAESARFSLGDGPAAFVVDGWRLGMRICKDTGAARHVVGTARLGVDAFVAGASTGGAARAGSSSRRRSNVPSLRRLCQLRR